MLKRGHGDLINIHYKIEKLDLKKNVAKNNYFIVNDFSYDE